MIGDAIVVIAGVVIVGGALAVGLMLFSYAWNTLDAAWDWVRRR